MQPKLSKRIALTTALVMIFSLCLAGSALAALGSMPKFLTSNPVTGSPEVDPALSEIVLTFDMDVQILDSLPGQAKNIKLKENGTNISFAKSMRDGKKLIITPTGGLKEDSTYLLTVPANSVGYTWYNQPFFNQSPITISFETGSEVDPGTPVTIAPIAAMNLVYGVDASAQANIVTNPADADVSCDSSNSSVATVNDDGLVTVQSAGTTVITVEASKDGFLTGSTFFNVNVANGTINITGVPASLNLVVDGANGQLNPQVNPADAAVTYSVSPSGIVSVNASGVVSPVTAGTATITVTASKANYNNATKTVNVTVSADEPEEWTLAVEPANVSLVVAETEQLAVTAPAGAEITYATNASAVATVSGTGKITAIGAGTATITVSAAYEGVTKTKTVAVSVTEATPGEITLTVSPAEVTLYVGETGQSFNLNVTVAPTDALLTYATDDAGVVTVVNGKLTAVAEGDATITVTASKDGYDSVEKTVDVTVLPFIPGDLNSDGELNVLDVQTAINIAIERIVPTALQIEAGDLNNDGKINILDVVKIINLVMEAE